METILDLVRGYIVFVLVFFIMKILIYFVENKKSRDSGSNLEFKICYWLVISVSVCLNNLGPLFIIGCVLGDISIILFVRLIRKLLRKRKNEEKINVN